MNLMTPKGAVRSNSQQENPTRLPAVIRLSVVLQKAVEHVVTASTRRAFPTSEDSGALVLVVRERDEDAPEHRLRINTVGVHLLLPRARGDLEECGVNGVIRRETPGELVFHSLCNALEPFGLERAKLSDLSPLGKSDTVHVAAFFFVPLDGRNHALYGGGIPAGDGECIAQHGGHTYSWKRLLYKYTKEDYLYQGGDSRKNQQLHSVQNSLFTLFVW